MKQTEGGAWKDGDLVSTYLTGIRAGIPLSAEQIETMCRVVSAMTGRVRRFVDLGCGDGILSAARQDRFAGASGVLVDHSGPMLEEARKRFAERGEKLRFVEADLSAAGWCGGLADAQFDAAVSGYCIHHLSDRRKQRLYGEVFRLLAPGGTFVNIEHVASPSASLSAVFDEAMVDSLYAHHQRAGTAKSREAVARDYVYRPDKAANILAPVERQCGWLRRIGFDQVDCYFKYLELAVFGGKKPEDE